MSNNIEVVLVGSFEESFIERLPLDFGLVPSEGIHGGDQLVMSTDIRTCVVKSTENTVQDVKKTIEEFITATDKDTLFAESATLVIDDDNDFLTGVYTIQK